MSRLSQGGRDTFLKALQLAVPRCGIRHTASGIEYRQKKFIL